MGDVQSTHFREILNAWKQELIEDIEKTMSVMQDENISLPDPNDRASLETDRSLELRTRDRERKLIKKINDSLSDLEKGRLWLLRRLRCRNRNQTTGSETHRIALY